MLDRHEQNRKKLEECYAQWQSMGMVPKSKMYKFYKNARLAYANLDKEFVECRRLKHTTARYQTLEQEYYECVTIFEQWSIMAVLMF
jgi:hypothetical protein